MMLCTSDSQTVCGLLLQEALQIAKGIDADTKFKASNGWLDSLILSKMTGECANVQEETVSEWYTWST